MTRTPAFATRLYFANGQTVLAGWPKEAGKPSPATAAGFLAVLQKQEVTADVARLEVFDNKGNKGVVATAARLA